MGVLGFLGTAKCPLFVFVVDTSAPGPRTSYDMSTLFCHWQGKRVWVYFPWREGVKFTNMHIINKGVSTTRPGFFYANHEYTTKNVTLTVGLESSARHLQPHLQLERSPEEIVCLLALAATGAFHNDDYATFLLASWILFGSGSVLFLLVGVWSIRDPALVSVQTRDDVSIR
jgi:hypothetical protein